MLSFLPSTVVSPSSSALRHWTRKIRDFCHNKHGLFYVLSPSSSLPDSDLADLVATLTSVPNSVGCLSSSLPIRSREPATALSFAVLQGSSNFTPFRSTIPGRKPTSVGRLHSVKTHQEERNPPLEHRSPQTSLEEIRGIQRYVLPSEIRDLKCVLSPLPRPRMLMAIQSQEYPNCSVLVRQLA